ncbi:MAG TPA: replication protein RepA [Terriglobia bacterium]|nr:replication protein RepA [Terriglobia bacterium]
MIREQREQQKQEVAFDAGPFVLCGVPLRPLPKDQLAYKRRNGKFFLQIIGHPDFALPFGQDCLIPIWVATLALRQKSRTVRFHSAAQILDFFRLPKDGRYYRRMAQGFQRIFAATIFFGTEDQPTGNHLIGWARFHFFDHLHLWFTEGKECSSRAAGQHRNTITLSEGFYREIDQHRLPIEREVVIALANAPGVLDFYVLDCLEELGPEGREDLHSSLHSGRTQRTIGLQHSSSEPFPSAQDQSMASGDSCPLARLSCPNFH